MMEKNMRWEIVYRWVACLERVVAVVEGFLSKGASVECHVCLWDETGATGCGAEVSVS
jgi:hypothetical protein